MIKQMSLIALGAATLFMAPTDVHAKVNTTGLNTVPSNVKVSVANSTEEALYLVSVPDFEFIKISNNNTNFSVATNVTNSLTVRNPQGEKWRLSVSAKDLTPDLYTVGNLPIKNATLKFGVASVSKVNLNDYDYEVKPATQEVANAIGPGQTIMEYRGNKNGEAGEAGEYAANYQNQAFLQIPRWTPKGSYESILTWKLEKVY